ncbi:MAG TPA: biosynthetic peptidoglycan transglycosylase, partial [Ktedonobacterales bacterium]
MDTPGTPPTPEDYPHDDAGAPSQNADEVDQSPASGDAGDAMPDQARPTPQSDEPLLPPIDDAPAAAASSAADIAAADELPHDAPADVSGAADGDGAVGPAEPYHPPYIAFVAPQVATNRLRANRRRLRYTLYVRRTSRARAAAKSATLTRATWASVIALLVLTVGVLATSVSAAAAYYSTEQVAIAALSRTVSARDSLRIYDTKGVLLYQRDNFGAQHSILLANMPIDIVNATVAIEDHTFWTNPGIDATSIVRAAQANYSSGSISQGGSTITQQLLKLNVLGSHDDYTRKLQEAILAVGMTESGTYTKQQILQMYLNSIGYGHEAYGIDSAAQIYFGYQD